MPRGDERSTPPYPPTYLRIARGDVTGEEIAALVGALTAVAAPRAGAVQPEPPSRASTWSDRSRLLRPAVHPSAGGWRQSALPR